jgi:hypothetical protein
VRVNKTGGRGRNVRSERPESVVSAEKQVTLVCKKRDAGGTSGMQGAVRGLLL